MQLSKTISKELNNIDECSNCLAWQILQILLKNNLQVSVLH